MGDRAVIGYRAWRAAATPLAAGAAAGDMPVGIVLDLADDRSWALDVDNADLALELADRVRAGEPPQFGDRVRSAAVEHRLPGHLKE